jgi:serine O-acetyltransferase
MSWLPSVRDAVRTAQERDPAARSTFEVLLAYPGIHALLLHRAAHRLDGAGFGLAARLLSHLGRFLTGIEIHPRARIGASFFIDHGMGVVIGETTEIGDHCHLYQGVTLGGTSTRREKRHPTLEDHVVVGAGAKIIGAVTIGHHARIGAGAVVVSSVPPHATVVGVPGHVVAFTTAGNDTVERLPDPGWDRIDELERRVKELETHSNGEPRDAAAASSPAEANAPLAPSIAPGPDGDAADEGPG